MNKLTSDANGEMDRYFSKTNFSNKYQLHFVKINQHRMKPSIEVVSQNSKTEIIKIKSVLIKKTKISG